MKEIKDDTIISLKNDLVFKKAFSDEKNIDMLQDLLSSILDIPYESIKNIKIKNSELIPQMEREKFSILDINLSAEGKLINIEMQVAQESFFKNRTLYYWAKLYTSDLKKGEGYDQLQQAICINFLDFNIFEYKKYHSVYEIKERDNNDLLTDKCQIHFLELKKYNKQNPGTRLDMWLQLINAKTKQDLQRASQSASMVIKKAVTVIMEMSADEKLKEEIRVREKAMLDIISHERERKITEEAIRERKEAIKEKEIAVEERKKVIKQLEKANKEKENIRQKGIQDLISIYKDFGVSLNETISKLMERCLLSEEEARKYIEKYW